MSASTEPASPKLAPGAVEITLIKFEPMKGTPGKPDYQSARLSYRIDAGGPGKVEFPVIDFSVESPAGKLFQRHFELPGTDFLEPGPAIDRTVSLDPSPTEDWAGVYQKTDQAKFSWSVKGKSNGSVEKPVHKAWP